MFYRRIHSDARGWRRTTTERCRRRLYFQQLESRRQSVWGLAQPVSVYDAATPHQERDTNISSWDAVMRPLLPILYEWNNKKMRRIWQSSKVIKIEVRVSFSFLSLHPEDVVYAR